MAAQLREIRRRGAVEAPEPQEPLRPEPLRTAFRLAQE
jgi:hypothetical protein